MEESILLQSQSLDFSFIALFLKATFTVKVVMLVLIFSSFGLGQSLFRKLQITENQKEKRKFF